MYLSNVLNKVITLELGNLMFLLYIKNRRPFMFYYLSNSVVATGSSDVCYSYIIRLCDNQRNNLIEDNFLRE
jgi:hypothetical protein